MDNAPLLVKALKEDNEQAELPWSSLVIRMGKCDHARGIVAGWKEAAAWLRHQAGEHFAAGNDEGAEQLRRVAVLIERKIPYIDHQREQAFLDVESSLWAEIDRRESEQTGAGEEG